MSSPETIETAPSRLETANDRFAQAMSALGEGRANITELIEKGDPVAIEYAAALKELEEAVVEEVARM